jgi:4-oxalocrotonate tautomerase
MPIITVQFIKDVVATPEQKRELIVRLTDTFVSVLGDVVRPFTYCFIQEVPVSEWGIAGVPMPDLAYLIGPEHAAVIERSNAQMGAAVKSQTSVPEVATTAPLTEVVNSVAQPPDRDQQADNLWRGVIAVPQNGRVSLSETVETYTNGYHEQVAAQTMPPSPEDEQAQHERYKAIVAEFYDVINEHDLAAAEGILAPDFLHYMELTGEPARKEVFMDSFQDFFRAFPDWRFQPEFVVAECDRVAVRGTVTGTFMGAFHGAPATGRRVAWTSFFVHRLDNEGRIAECWQNYDAVSMQTQCGLLPLKT